MTFALDLLTGTIYPNPVRDELPKDSYFKMFRALNLKNAERKILAWKKKEWWVNNRWIDFMAGIALQRVDLKLNSLERGLTTPVEGCDS